MVCWCVVVHRWLGARMFKSCQLWDCSLINIVYFQMLYTEGKEWDHKYRQEVISASPKATLSSMCFPSSVPNKCAKVHQYMYNRNYYATYLSFLISPSPITSSVCIIGFRAVNILQTERNRHCLPCDLGLGRVGDYFCSQIWHSTVTVPPVQGYWSPLSMSSASTV